MTRTGPEIRLEASAVSRCRRRVHLDHDPTAERSMQAGTDPAAEQRRTDALEHRERVLERLGQLCGSGLVRVPSAAAGWSVGQRQRRTRELLRGGTAMIAGAVLPADGGRRGAAELLVRTSSGYVPVIVVRHKVVDPGTGATTGPLARPWPGASSVDEQRKLRSQPRDQLRLAHLMRMLERHGWADPDPTGSRWGGVIGVDAEIIVWLDLAAPTWPGGSTALRTYDERFADRIAVATAAARQQTPLAYPLRILECRSCPWWPVCHRWLQQRSDVSLVLRGETALALREAGYETVERLAAADPHAQPPQSLSGLNWLETVLHARAWLRDLPVVRRRERLEVPRADVELDVDMESFGDAGAYLWGCLLSGVEVGRRPGYHAFVSWQPLPDPDEGRAFGQFWQWLRELRADAEDRGLSFKAYCYNEMAENRWLLASARRFAGMPGVPAEQEVRAFIDSQQWVDLFRVVREEFLCPHGKGLKVIAPAAGFHWRDAEAGGENSMRWYREAVAMDGGLPDEEQQHRLLEYNEDDVRATYALRRWMSSPELAEIPTLDQLVAADG